MRPELATLFSSLSIERTPQGAVQIAAPPEVAPLLISLFEGFAMALKNSLGPDGR